MRRKCVRLFVLVLAAAVALEAAAVAQVVAPGVPTSTQGAQVRKPKDWQIGVGFAPVFAPAWQGSRDQALSIFPDLRINYKDAVFFSVPDGLGWNVVNQDGWKIGPLFKFRFGRNEDNGGSPFLISGGSEALRGMGDVGFAGEPGAYAQYSFAGNKARVRAEVRQGFGGHEGTVADTSIGWSDRIGQPLTPGFWIYSASLRATFASAEYTNPYFGVNAQQAAATGLGQFRTGSGLVSSGINTSITKPFGKYGQFGAVTLFGGYDRLGDVVTDSTLIQERGKRDQFSVGLSYGLRFGFGGGK
jgi:outer membrane scaffolding protein for murein synthesis (MipA/OmpV family)